MSELSGTHLRNIAHLRLRVSKLRGPDPYLGLDLAFLIASLAAEQQVTPMAKPVVTGLAPDSRGSPDPTSSLGAAFDLLDRVHPGAGFMFYPPDGPGKPLSYHLDKSVPPVVYFGEGWTRHACVLDAILHALEPRAGTPKPKWDREAEEISLSEGSTGSV
jgi:hypothetical protein